MENINTMAMTSVSRIPGSTSAFAMPIVGCTSGVQRWVDATGLTTGTSVLRTRTDVAAKGHVALIAYVPGIHAWSPPIC